MNISNPELESLKKHLDAISEIINPAGFSKKTFGNHAQSEDLEFKTKLNQMVENDTPETRCEYLIELISEVQQKCHDQDYWAVPAFDNLIRVANDVLLSIKKENYEPERV